MVKLRAVKKVGNIVPGKIFERTKVDANILVALKLAERVEDHVETSEDVEDGDMATRHLRAERPRQSSKKKASKKTSPPPGKNTYRRRDMVAE